MILFENKMKEGNEKRMRMRSRGGGERKGYI